MKCIDLFNSTAIADFLSKDAKEHILSSSSLITYKKGESLVKKGEYVTNAIFLCAGYVKIHLDYTKRSIILNLMGPRKFILLESMISEDLQPFNVTAIDDATVCLCDIKLFKELANTNANLSFQMLQHLEKAMIYYITHNLASLTQNNIHGRLANTIIYLAEKVFQSNSFDMLLSRKELSELCNISRENVIKVLYEFDKDGIINLHGKNIHINSMDGLRRIANHG
jgi:CRP/FNR family transcriptional regulator